MSYVPIAVQTRKAGYLRLYHVDVMPASYTATPPGGIELMTNSVLPPFAAGNALAGPGIVVAGGLKTGQIGVSMVMNVESIAQLEEILEQLPLWPRMTTDVTTLSSSAVRAQSTLQRHNDTRRHMQERAGLKPTEH
jgi:hypothetical protein